MSSRADEETKADTRHTSAQEQCVSLSKSFDECQQNGQKGDRATVVISTDIGTRPCRDTKKKPDFKPMSHQWPFLITLIIILLIFLGLVELALRQLPSKGDSIQIPNQQLAVNGHSKIAMVMPSNTTTGSGTTLGITKTSSVTTDGCVAVTRTIFGPGPTTTVGEGDYIYPTAIDNINATRTETYPIIWTTIVVGAQSSPQVRRRDCSTVTIYTQSTAATRSGDYVNIGTVTLTFTSTRPIRETDSAVVTLLPPLQTGSGNPTDVSSKTSRSPEEGTAKPHSGSSSPTKATITIPAFEGSESSVVVVVPVPSAVGSDPEATAVVSGGITRDPSNEASLNLAAVPTGVWSVITSVLTDSGGSPMTVTQDALFIVVAETLTDGQGRPTATRTLTDAFGRSPLMVISSMLMLPYTTVMSDDRGNPTATLTLSSTIPLVPVTAESSGMPTTWSQQVLTLTDSEGAPTATITAPGPDTTSATTTYTVVYTISLGQYFTGMFVPTLLATIIAIPLHVIDLNARRLKPFHAMARGNGASASGSLLMDIGGFGSIMTSRKALRIRKGDGLLYITTSLIICSAFLTAIAAEAISLRLHGACANGNTDDMKNCAVSLAVSEKPARTAEALLAVMAALTIIVLLIFRRWPTGVTKDPWGMGGLSLLLTHPETQKVIGSALLRGGKLPTSEMKKALNDTRVRLEHFRIRDEMEYGIVSQQPRRPTASQSICSSDTSLGKKSSQSEKCQNHLPMFALRRSGLALHLVFLLGLLILIIAYNKTGGSTPFEYFMDTETFGVRFLFALLGVLTTFLFSSVFSGICILVPYRLLSRPTSLSARVFHTPPPTNPFTAVYTAFRIRSVLLGSTALLNILAEFLPVLLANIPYRTTQTYETHMVCTWLCVGILCILALKVLYLMCFVRWPHLPADVRTVAGFAWYLVGIDSSHESSGQVAKMKGKDRCQGQTLCSRCPPREEGHYMFGNYIDTQGNQRVGVRWFKAAGEAIV